MMLPSLVQLGGEICWGLKLIGFINIVPKESKREISPDIRRETNKASNPLVSKTRD